MPLYSLPELNQTWERTVRKYAVSEQIGDLTGERFRPIGDKVFKFMDALWANKASLPDIGTLIEAGKTVKFWADPHFGHANIIRLCDRTEFETVEQMNADIIASVEDALSASDLVVCIGDLAIKHSIDIHRQLIQKFGERHCHVIGNHDLKNSIPSDWIRAGNVAASGAFSLPVDVLKSWIDADHGELTELVEWDRLPRQVNFGCCHWPIPPEHLPDATSWVSLHGHIHHLQSGPQRVNCSVEAIGYKPRTLRELLTPNLLADLVHGGR